MAMCISASGDEESTQTPVLQFELANQVSRPRTVCTLKRMRAEIDVTSMNVNFLNS
jgi:hypothetical protein